MNELDLEILYVLNSLIGKSALQDFLVLLFASYLLYVVLGVFAYNAYRHWKKQQSILPYVYALAAALVSRFVVAEAIRLFYHHERPFVALGIPHLIDNFSYSFPSGHAIFMFSLAAAVYFFNPRLGFWLYVAALCTGVARVMAGVHYPSDIVGGAVLGILTSLCVHALWVRFATKT